jgi:acyl phosphate:glycerol-3-phosphate acyltransferase
MLNLIYLLLAALIGYFFGAIPFGFLFVKATKKIDLRQVGSGRTGGTNSFRAAGLGIGILTALSDFLKGACAIWIARGLFSGILNETWLPWAAVACGAAAVMGHNWSIFLGWKGGAGTGPNVGWAAAVWWPLGPLAVIVLLVMLLGVGMASLASLSVGILIPIVFGVRYAMGLDPTPAYLVGSLLTLVIVTWSLRPNIRRIFEGTERIVGPRARAKKRQTGVSQFF